MRFDAAPMPFLRDIMHLLNVLCTARNSTWCQHAMQHFDAGQTREERAEVFSREKKKKKKAHAAVGRKRCKNLLSTVTPDLSHA